MNAPPAQITIDYSLFSTIVGVIAFVIVILLLLIAYFVRSINVQNENEHDELDETINPEDVQ